MHRVTSNRFREPINRALELIPGGVRPLLNTDLFCGADPVFAGLHHYESMSFGRSYRTTAHCVYNFHQEHLPRARRRTTVVLPTVPDPETVVHELGHALHATLGWRFSASPVSWYAETDRYEAFAEAFTAWCIPGYAVVPDEASRNYFDQLAASLIPSGEGV